MNSDIFPYDEFYVTQVQIEEHYSKNCFKINVLLLLLNYSSTYCETNVYVYIYI